MNYYNEIDPFCCKWLANLMDAGLIPQGKIDQRSIKDVQPSDLDGFTQCHFFAGIAGWSYALQLAGWPANEPVWTGSCPCQPFSQIGMGLGFKDERHLWPEWFRLVRQHRPSTIFGEQVANASVWLDQVFTDLESQGYAVGASYLPAAGVGARHTRQRIWFVADSNKARWENAARIAATKEKSEVGTAASVVCGEPHQDFRRSFEPDASWVIDGVPGDGLATSAIGNAIVPQVAAEFIKAYMEVLQ